MTPEQKLQADKQAFMLQYYGCEDMPGRSEDEPGAAWDVSERTLREIDYLSLRSIESLTSDEIERLVLILFNDHPDFPITSEELLIESYHDLVHWNAALAPKTVLLALDVSVRCFGGHILVLNDGTILLYDEDENLKFCGNTIAATDYLRSIGILLPFREYSVEQILSLGWAQYQGGGE